MSYRPSQPYGPKNDFATLVEDISKHRWFPVIIKKVFDVSGSKAFQDHNVLSPLSQMEHDAAALQAFAATHGCRAAEERWSRTDVFISVVIVALNQMVVLGTRGCGELSKAVAICRAAVSKTWIDPRFVGATNNHRTGRNNETQPIPQAADIRRPDTTRQGVSAVPRSNGIQRVSGIQKSGRGTRKLLSDKAKSTLERWFQGHLEDPYPSAEEKKELATLCDINVSSVNNWFGNKRMRIKRKMLQMDSHGSDHIAEKVLAPRSKWNAVVMSRMTSQTGREVFANASGLTFLPPKNDAINKEDHSNQVQEQAGPSGPGRPTKNKQPVTAIHKA